MENKGYFSFRWVIVGIGVITLALAYGAAMYSFSVFFVALIKEFNWSRSMGAGAFSLFMIVHGIMGPFAGSMVDRFGPRIVFLSGSLTVALGFVLCSLIRSWWQFYIFFGAVTAVGVGFIGWVPNTTVIQQWFSEKRGLAMGIISSGIGIGIFICVPVIQHLISRIGWRMSYLIVAFFIPAIIIPLALAFLKKPPQIIASHHPVKEAIDPSTIDLLGVDEQWASRCWTLRQAATTKQFCFLSFSFFLSGFAVQSLLIHHVAYFIDQGMKALLASYIAGLIGIVSIAGKIFWGILSDKIGREITYTIGTACAVCGMIFLIGFTIFPHGSFPYLYALLFGLGYAVVSSLPPLIAADFFQGGAYGSIFGTLNMVTNIGGACGVWFTGFLFDRVRSYVPAVAILIVCILCALVNIWIAAPRRVRVVPGRKALKLKRSEQFETF